MTKILSFNTTDNFMRLMLQENDKILFQQIITEKNKHSEFLIPLIENILKKSELDYCDLNAISAIKGPGNFMGLRAGISVANAIKISTCIPIITITFFDLLIFDEKIEENTIIAVKANLDNYYIQQLNKYLILNYDEIANQKNARILTNDEKLLKLSNATKIDFSFKNWAKLVYQKYEKKEFDKNIKPLYIRPPQITQRKNKI
jgi:tRNA threonylcarbamoyl adenosine modification protein YeaZ